MILHALANPAKASDGRSNPRILKAKPKACAQMELTVPAARHKLLVVRVQAARLYKQKVQPIPGRVCPILTFDGGLT